MSQKDTEHTEALKQILLGFGAGDLTKIQDAMLRLGRCATETVGVQDEVVKITNELHNTIEGFKRRLDPANLTMNTTNIPDAAKKLEYVLNATNEASMRLFALVELQEKILEDEQKDLGELESSKISVAVYAQKQRERLKDFKSNLSSMVMTQEYQDLCGQALAKVLNLVRDIEGQLRSLMKQLGIEEQTSNALSPDETKYDQDDTDALLKELGF